MTETLSFNKLTESLGGNPMRFLGILSVIFFSAVSAFASPFKGGKQVSLANIFEISSIASAIDDSKGWCTPAMQVGPKVFITAAHCLPIFNQSSALKIMSKGINKQVKFSSVSLGESLKDETTFNSPECKVVISGISNGTELTLEQMKTCWANDGQADVALLIVEEAVPGEYLSVAQKVNASGDILMLLGYTPDCGGDPQFFRAAQFATYGFNNLQVVLNGIGMGFSDPDSSACGGDSGGGYLRFSNDNAVELTAIHSGGTKEESTHIPIHGKKVILPKYFAGGTDLTNVEVRTWLLSIANQYQVEICGVNRSCFKVSKLP